MMDVRDEAKILDTSSCKVFSMNGSFYTKDTGTPHIQAQIQPAQGSCPRHGFHGKAKHRPSSEDRGFSRGSAKMVM